MSNFDFLGSFLGKRAKLTKDGHDISSMEAGSLPFGVNVPVGYYPVVPNEHYSVKLSGVLQTAPMREDNFASIFSNQKAVFVPISSIWRNYISLTQNDRSSRKEMLFDYDNYFPVFYIADVLNLVFPSFVISRLVQSLVSVVPDYYNYFVNSSGHFEKNTGEGLVSLGSVIPAWDENADAAVKAARMLYAIIDGVGLPEDYSLSSVVSDVLENVTPAGTPIYMDTLRLLDNLGYGNYYPNFEAFYSYVLSMGLRDSTILSNYFTYNLSGFSVEEDYWYEFIDREASRFSNNTLISSDVVSALPLLCYQYYVSLVERSNYRKPDTVVLSYDSILSYIQSNGTNDWTNIVDSNLIFQFSFDWHAFFNDGSLGSAPADFRSAVNELFTFKRHTLDNVYSGDISIDDFSQATIFVYLFSLNNPKLPSDLYTTMTDSVVSGSEPSTDLSDVQQNIVKAYADASALYSLRQDLLRAGVRRDKQMQAIFGVSGTQHLYESIRVLDDTSSEVAIQGLLNQAETSEAALGARAARGNGKFGLSFKFDSEEFGYIFILQNFTCAIFYENFMLDRAHCLAPESWFNPKFNHLGLEAVHGKYVSTIVGESYNSFVNPFNKQGDRVVGYSSRNYELKQRVNKVHGAFTNFPLPIAGNNNISVYQPADLTRGNSIFGGFVPTVLTQQTEFFDNRTALYYSPEMVNNIFVDMVAGGLYGEYSFDPFRIAYSFNVRKVSPMPKIGLFKLDV